MCIIFLSSKLVKGSRQGYGINIAQTPLLLFFSLSRSQFPDATCLLLTLFFVILPQPSLYIYHAEWVLSNVFYTICSIFSGITAISGSAPNV